jgi:hypothetical protein
VFFSAQIRDSSMLGMVFMPILMGALSYPIAKPVGTVKPPAPVRPVRPVKAAVDTGEAGQKLATEIASTELTGLRATLEDLVAKRTELVDAATVAVERDHRILLDNYLYDLKAYRKARHAWRALVETWEEGEEGLAKRMAVWDAGAKAWGAALEENLGVIYAYHKDSLPRSVNGYPMFMSCVLLHKLDWELVRKAIDKELERQKDIDLGDDLPTAETP